MNTDLREWSIFRKADGMFTGGTVRALTFVEIAGNANDEYGLIEGVFDWQSQRVELETMEIVDYRPEAPDDDHEWIHDDPVTGARVRRHRLKLEVAEQRARRARAITEIEELEKRQIRSMSDLFDDANNKAARKAYNERKQRINELAVEAGIRKPSNASEAS